MLERMNAFSNPSLIATLVAGCLVAMLVVAAVSVLAMMRAGARAEPRIVTQIRLLTGTLCGTYLIFVVVFVVGVYELAIKYDDRFAFGIPWWFSVGQRLPFVCLLLTAALSIVMFRSRAHRPRSYTGGVAIAASLVLLPIVWSWHAYQILSR